MAIITPSPQPHDKDLLRQREIAAQTNARKLLSGWKINPLLLSKLDASPVVVLVPPGRLLTESAHLLDLIQRWQQGIQTARQIASGTAQPGRP